MALKKRKGTLLWGVLLVLLCGACAFLRFSAFLRTSCVSALLRVIHVTRCIVMTSSDSSMTAHEASEAQPKSLFEDISADNVFSEIESLCMNCHEQGTTRLLLTRVPFFKEIIVMAFTCPYCGYESNEIQSGSEIQEKGVHYVLQVQTKKVISSTPTNYFTSVCFTLFTHFTTSHHGAEINFLYNRT
jgi:predicted metal-binding protein